jgi:hypothetical protein
VGGIVIIVKTPHGERRWGGHSMEVMKFFKLTGINAVEKGDSHDGTIIFDSEERKIIIDTDYGKISKEVVRFWRCLGFDVLGRLES